MDPTDLGAVADALEVLIHAKTWEEIRSVWEQCQDLLLTDHAERLLSDQIRRVGPGVDSRQEKDHLTSHLAFIRSAREHDMDAAWKAYERAHQNHLLQTTWDWLQASSYREQRQFLEAHTELTESSSLNFLDSFITENIEDSEELRNLQDKLALLRDASLHGGTTEAIREAYINRYDGFVLDIPPWLEEIEHQLDEIYRTEETEQGEKERASIALLHSAIQRAQSSSSHVAPETFATLNLRLWSVLDVFDASDDPQLQEEKINCLEIAISILDEGHYPHQWAGILYNLGVAYAERSTGERAENIERALANFQDILRVRTRSTLPIEWAQTQHSLGLTYMRREVGDPSANLELALNAFVAALQVYTAESAPRQWANCQLNLGIVYTNRIAGERAQNLRDAINCFNAALQVYTAESFPEKHRFLLKLRAAVENEITGKSSEEEFPKDDITFTPEEAARAISDPAYLAAKLGVDLDDFNIPAVRRYLRRMILEQSSETTDDAIAQTVAEDGEVSDWEFAQMFMQWLFVKDVREQRELVERFPEILDVRGELTLQNMIEDDALGEARQNLIDRREVLRDARAQGGTRTAIRAAYVNRYGGFILDLPLWLEQVRSKLEDLIGEKQREGAVQQRVDLCRFAITEAQKKESTVAPETLASLYGALFEALEDAVAMGKDRAQIQQEELACLQAALQVFTRERYPWQWASFRANLGNIYLQWIGDNPPGSREQVIACYRDALQIITREQSPKLWVMLQDNLLNASIEETLQQSVEEQAEAIAALESVLRAHAYNNSPQELTAMQAQLGIRYALKDQFALEQAISNIEATLQTYTRDAFPEKWARTQLLLGVLYAQHGWLTDNRAENTEQAIAHFENAQQVSTRERDPFFWVSIQLGLSDAYRERFYGGRENNLELSLEYAQAGLQIVTGDTHPLKWARLQSSLGRTYSDRIKGDRAENQERAIISFENALQIITPHNSPQEWGNMQNDLGNIYLERIRGDRAGNLEKAIAFYGASLQVRTRERFPVSWAITQTNLGAAYVQRIIGDRGENLERAITSLENALEITVRDTYPVNWARIQLNLGSVYRERTTGDPAENRKRAITAYEAALQVYSREAFPVEWAGAHHNLGTLYIRHDRVSSEDLVSARGHYEAALQVFTLDAYPERHRITALFLAVAETANGHWNAAHAAYSAAQDAEDLLFALGIGIRERDRIVRGDFGAGSQDGFALAQLGRLEEAVVAIERGRTRSLAEARLLNTADPERIRDAGRRQQFIDARQAYLQAQAALQLPLSLDLDPAMISSDLDARAETIESAQRRAEIKRTDAYHQTKVRFDTVVTEIREAHDPADFLDNSLDASTILHAMDRSMAGHALIYLLATPWGGLAIGALSGDSGVSTHGRFIALDLPALTNTFVGSLIMDEGDTNESVIGGFMWAQQEISYTPLLNDWPGETFAEKAANLHKACLLLGKESTLDAAAQAIFAYPLISKIAAKPLEELEESEFTILNATLSHAFLQRELHRCLPKLSDVALRPLGRWLHDEGATALTLIPCGALAIFPLLAAPINDNPTNSDEWQTIGDLFPSTVAPSARSLLRGEHTGTVRTGIYALGNPLPTHQSLRWGEAEARTLALLGGHSDHAVIQYDATRSWLIQVLQHAKVFDASCHGEFDRTDFLQSQLHLANEEGLTLGDALNNVVSMDGLRLLILSACQTAILDISGAIDEVRSLAVGMVQAGAEAVLGTLWSVDDEATYLLIVRFAQEWFPHMHEEPPAAAFARAQRWLRTVTNRDLVEWRATMPPLPVLEEQSKVGSTRPQQDLSAPETRTMQDSVRELVAIRGRGNRYEVNEAESLIRSLTKRRSDPDARLYADPIYWAGFQVTGW